MLTSTRRSISYPNTTRVDAPDIPAHIKNLVDALDVDVFIGSGTLSGRPVSTSGSPGINGRLYYSTDAGQLDFDFGTGWITLYPQTGTSVPIGGALEWDYAAAGIPSWALLQYGQAINRTTYAALAALAAAASYPHGAGDGSTTFNLADKRGRVSAGKDDMGGVTAGRITAAISGTAGTVLGAVVGAEGVTLTTGQIPSHNHSLTGTPGITDPGHTHNVTDVQFTGANSVQVGTPQTNPNAATTATTSATTGITATLGSLGVANTGGGGVHLNVQPTIIVNKIIRAL